MEDGSLFVNTDLEAATDVITLLKEIYNGNKTIESRSLYIFAESYGGKSAVPTALAILQAIKNGELNLQLEGTYYIN